VTSLARVAVIADSMALVRLGVAAVLEPMGVKVVAETATGRDAPRLVREHGAALVIAGPVQDVPLAELVRRLKALSDRPSVLVMLGGSSSKAEIAELLSLDIDGLVLRSLSADDLADAVERIRRGERVVAPGLLPSLLGAVGPLAPSSEAEGEPGGELTLTKREREVLALLAEGRSNRELAAAMYVTLATVKTHLAHIYAKLDASNRNEAIGRAIALGLIG
jgi:DNA-binding NarL/FixJ family response regulator